MALSPYNISSNDSSTPGYRRSARDLHYRYGSVAHQYPPSLAAEPSMFTDNHLLCNIMQHLSEPVHPSSPMPSASPRADFNPPNHNTIHYPSIGNNIPSEPLAMGYLSSGHSTTTPSASGASTPSMDVSRHEVHTLYDETLASHPSYTQLAYHCQANIILFILGNLAVRTNATGKTASIAGVLMRHIETQHVAPHSFDCPVCGKLFCRRDNMTKHLGRIHLEQV
ncbi:hypothetical protein N7491_010552 [Penicillium cf. griseofulvum]|uniref:C2H2-type domain-containing protein n=1 Tax=Penicillium cf. griseofulvum TaxID=2972120 RepID=A0A9W9N0Y3_9EURO|nr:hypothetical protein N7472_000882 [Penicillium cf. griseofulvum]KAJ5422107.1 hypothetical protein N7491_010552 [Penicillium cf. griseofulvum]KAJ5428295.1 hypothetical protein N7445_009749 [Penicillium cf. griseofulvum]